MMNEVKESLRSVEQKYQLFQQQQFTFIAALEHCRENASDKIRPISSIGQVEARGLTGGRGAALETPARGLGRGTGVPGAGLSRPLLPPCRCPPDMANYLSCHEARNHCGGVVSLIPIVLDMMKEWVAHSEKLPRKALQHVSEPQATGTQPRLRKDKCG
ncbi:sperm acrosome-associated protein 9 [Delphinapterus leucas]|uniref:Sperm acrosome-associated protein 9 n=1 Tax=Delphinapterus leucas TaxID=9749 RepID=A0A7F8KBF7_DELLE|nr:sperm acrosome-associated protein 9 [Delphinapterus leucas]